MSNEDINISRASCGWFNPKTGESGTFINKKQEEEYNNLPWYKKFFTPKPTTKVAQSNPYLPPEFCKQIKYKQNYIESGLFCKTRQFSVNGAINVFIERNRYEKSYDRYFYTDENDNKIYIDAKAFKLGIITEIPV